MRKAERDAAQEKNMGRLIQRFLQDEAGATAIEYGLIAAGIPVGEHNRLRCDCVTADGRDAAVAPWQSSALGARAASPLLTLDQ